MNIVETGSKTEGMAKVNKSEAARTRAEGGAVSAEEEAATTWMREYAKQIMGGLALIPWLTYGIIPRLTYGTIPWPQVLREDHGLRDGRGVRRGRQDRRRDYDDARAHDELRTLRPRAGARLRAAPGLLHLGRLRGERTT